MGRESRANGNRNPLQFQTKQVPVVGQPFTLVSVSCPMNAHLRCNCGSTNADVSIVGSVGAACPSCGKMFNMAFNPTTMKVECVIGVPTQKEPS